MDDFRGRIKYFGAVPGRSLTAADMKVLISQAWIGVGELWHSEMRPKHFTVAGAAEYGYLPRQGEPGNPYRGGFWASYTGRKLRKHHHRSPLKYSGELEQLSRARRIDTTVFRTKSRMRVIMPGARKANFRNPASKIDMREELTRVSEQEQVRLAERHNRTMAERLRLFAGSTAKEA